MSQNIRDLLEDYQTEPVIISELVYPAPPQPEASQMHRLLVLAGDNLLELMEEIVDEHESLSHYVQQSAEQAASLSLADGLRRSLAWLFEYNELPASFQPLEKLSAAQLYEAYRQLQQSEQPLPMLDETITETTQMLPVPDADWAESRQENGAFWLTLPVEREYEAPLMIPMGGYNECPLPTCQAAIFRVWQEQYGAIPIAVNESTWVLEVQHLPLTDADALELAREHVLFCPYVLESFETIGEYAGYLKHHTIWYFWWD
ncbi:DUF4253 domain-containing protein [Paenibacillus kandeliae]|uniref:DUF4253 domain-containing protein n=1 Tax=Paenibacillus kandeliae TaxID=3231269 RepID=UPI00345A2052